MNKTEIYKKFKDTFRNTFLEEIETLALLEIIGLERIKQFLKERDMRIVKKVSRK